MLLILKFLYKKGKTPFYLVHSSFGLRVQMPHCTTLATLLSHGHGFETFFILVKEFLTTALCGSIKFVSCYYWKILTFPCILMIWGSTSDITLLMRTWIWQQIVLTCPSLSSRLSLDLYFFSMTVTFSSFNVSDDDELELTDTKTRDTQV